MWPLPHPVFQSIFLFVGSIALPFFTQHTAYGHSLGVCHCNPEVVYSSYLDFKAVPMGLGCGYRPAIAITRKGGRAEAEGLQVPGLPGSRVTSNLVWIDM